MVDRKTQFNHPHHTRRSGSTQLILSENTVLMIISFFLSFFLCCFYTLQAKLTISKELLYTYAICYSYAMQSLFLTLPLLTADFDCLHCMKLEYIFLNSKYINNQVSA
jgi:hypothetical protein